MRSQGDLKVVQRLRAGKIHAPSCQLAPVAIDRHRVRLQPVLHLQPVLEGTQKLVSVGKLRVLAFGEQPAFGQPAQAYQSVRRAQPPIAPSKGDLQGLRDEFDFANAAAPKFDVKAHLFQLALAINLLLGQPDVSQRVRDADVRSKDASDHTLREPAIKRLRPGCSPRANQRLQFPILRSLVIVARGLVKRTSQGAISSVRTQAHVNAIGGALAGRLANYAQKGFG